MALRIARGGQAVFAEHFVDEAAQVVAERVLVAVLSLSTAGSFRVSTG